MRTTFGGSYLRCAKMRDNPYLRFLTFDSSGKGKVSLLISSLLSLGRRTWLVGNGVNHTFLDLDLQAREKCVSPISTLLHDLAGWPSARALPRHDLPHQLDTTCLSSPQHKKPLMRTWKTQGGASAAGGAPTLKSVTRTPKENWENMLRRTVLKAHNPSRMSRNKKRTSANSVKFTFIARFLLSPGRYAFGRVARIQPCTCHHLGWGRWLYPALHVSSSELG